MENRYSDAAPVKVKLLQGAVYAEEADTWKIVLAHEETGELREYFQEIGQTLIVDRAEGWAYLEQQDLGEDPKMVQLFKRRPLSFEATVLLLVLREELLRFDATPRAVETVPTVRLTWLLEELSAFVPEQNNAVKREQALKAVTRQGVTMGVLREIGSEEEDTVYQILRLIKAKLPEAKISEIREILKTKPAAAEGENGNELSD